MTPPDGSRQVDLHTGLCGRADSLRSGEADGLVPVGDDRILVGDVRAMLSTLPAESVHCVVTSPPYWSLRSYSTTPQLWGGDPTCAHAFDPEPTAEGYTGKRKWQHSSNGAPGWSDKSGLKRDGRSEESRMHTILNSPKRNSQPVSRKTEPGNWSQVTRGDTCRLCGCWRGELGGEPDPESYVEHIVEVFREVWRVLRKDGTCWVNLGDSYASHDPGGYRAGEFLNPGGAKPKKQGGHRNRAGTYRPDGLKPKDLVGIPWRVAFALQADGWTLRQDIVWAKPSAMPESVKDRCTKSHEYIFLLAKSSRYYFDPIAIAEPIVKGAAGSTFNNGKTGVHQLGRASEKDREEDGLRNKRSVWTINTEPTSLQHFATFPEKLVEPCILAGTSERGVCRQCAAPWRRVTERTEPSYWEQRKAHDYGDRKTVSAPNDNYKSVSRGRPENSGVGYSSSVTTGWQPSCKHPGDPIPATVLDIFLGSGTTARVAERLGRNWVGIELSSTYAEIARRRTAQRGLFQFAAGGDG